MKESDRTFFQPLWRRVVLLGLLLGWTGLEWWGGDQFWGVMTSAAALYALWTFFLNFDASPAPDAETKPDSDAPRDDPEA